jgi:alpha-N-arabinofuranosidase
MANIAQTVNVLQAVILTEGEKMLVTPTGHVYEMYAPHQGATSVRTLIETDLVGFKRGEKDGSLPVIAASASLNEETLFLTITNSHAEQAQEVNVELLGGAKVNSASALILTGEIDAHNTFDKPDEVKPETMDLIVVGPSFTISLPPASVAAVSIQLA